MVKGLNQTVTEVVETSSKVVREEINLLKTSVNDQIKTLSDKETRHHIESNIIVREELEKMNTKLTNFDKISIQLNTYLKSLDQKINNIEKKQTRQVKLRTD